MKNGALSGKPFLEMLHVTHCFGKRTALTDLNLSLSRGEVFGLLGPNGAGKSTLLSLLATLQRPCEGDICMEGVSILKRPNVIRRRMGYVPQELALHLTLTARENLRFWAGVYGLSGLARDQAVQEALERMHLADRAMDRIETWSGGMKRRLNLAAAIMHQPDLLLLDEPTAGVDAGSRRTIAALLHQFRQEGKTVLVASHDTDELEAVCDRVGVLAGGRLIAIGSVNEVLERAGHDTLEAFLLGLEE